MQNRGINLALLKPGSCLFQLDEIAKLLAVVSGLRLQGVLHWVGQPRPGQDPAQFEARLYDRLFSTQTPGSKRKKPNEQE